MNYAARSTLKSPSRREELSPIVVKRKHDHAVEVDMFKAHRGDESLSGRIDLAARSLAPGIERALQGVRVVGHHEIRAQRQTVGLRSEFLLAFATGGARARVANLSLQLMGAFVVI